MIPESLWVVERMQDERTPIICHSDSSIERHNENNLQFWLEVTSSSKQKKSPAQLNGNCRPGVV